MVNEEETEPVPPPVFETDPDPDTDPEPDTTETGPPPPDVKPWYKDPLGGVLVGLGGVAVGAGVGLVVGASVEKGKNAANYEEFVERNSRVKKMQIAGAITAGVGGALLIGGVVRWSILGARQNARMRSSAMVLQGGGGVVFSGRF